ncbi:MAG: phosphatidylinositol-specific phospholipase C/glycerophosphodiester phosphodiesterase family protein [Saprospiraceae bacterium]|nr:phosphatidylinositol-specific phospholipase C/glycerophosphodiester phosphodiesterase family protein [Saprospiraceae bacterium]
MILAYIIFLFLFYPGSNDHLSTGPVPKSHAHNDYLHDRPLFDALAQGFISVEADILLDKDKLYVGHNKVDLVNKPLMSLDSLYLLPLYQRYNELDGSIYPGYSGRFYLWIDIKYEGKSVIELLEKLIGPYRTMLYSPEKNPKGKVQLIISGDRPYDLILEDDKSYFFLDGRPADLGDNYSSGKMPFISQNIYNVCQINGEGFLENSELAVLEELVDECHHEGKKIRLWATPDNERMWEQLLRAEVDLINTDNLSGLALFLKKQ